MEPSRQFLRNEAQKWMDEGWMNHSYVAEEGTLLLFQLLYRDIDIYVMNMKSLEDNV